MDAKCLVKVPLETQMGIQIPIETSRMAHEHSIALKSEDETPHAMPESESSITIIICPWKPTSVYRGKRSKHLRVLV